MNTDIAISVKNVSKTLLPLLSLCTDGQAFRIPHDPPTVTVLRAGKVSSLRGAFTQALKGKTTYEEFKALDDVSFEACPNAQLLSGRVKKGEFFGIIDSVKAIL